MSKHTPGPWDIYFNSQDDLIVRKMFPDGQESHQIARCHSGAYNAFLIAAAPDLLAVLEELQESAAYWSEYDVPIGIVDRINAAIAKAKGEA